jgi:hypothetical protein
MVKYNKTNKHKKKKTRNRSKKRYTGVKRSVTSLNDYQGGNKKKESLDGIITYLDSGVK